MGIVTVTNTLDSGAGSLRAALANAQTGDTIKFAPGLANQKITLTSGDIRILKEVTIDGSNAPNLTISGNDRNRIFNIGDRWNIINVTIKNLKFTDGRAVIGTTDDREIGEGGAIRIHNFSDLIVENSTFNNNVAERGGAIRVGFGGSLTVRNSTFDGNDGSIAKDGFSAGAIATYGSGGLPDIDPGNGFVIIEDSTFTNNKGSVGGAVYSLLGPLTIEDSVFKNNESLENGGAVFTDGADKNERDTKGGNIIIRNTVVEDNKAKGLGGGLFLWTYEADQVLIENSTIAENSVSYGGRHNDAKGGGVFIGSRGTLTIRDSAIINNTADHQGGGLWVNSDDMITIENSTFSGNQAKDDIGGAITINTPDETPVDITNTTFVNNSAGRYSGAIWSHSKNSDDITLTNTIFAGNTSNPKQMHTNFELKDGGGNFVERNPQDRGAKVTANATYVDDLKLSELQQTRDDWMHLLESDSPAINAGNNNGATKTDQRGVSRDGKSDAGAFEFVASTPDAPTDINPQSAVPQQPPTLNESIRYEMENLNLTGYKVESVAHSGASDGKHISLRHAGVNSGKAQGTFNGEAGVYQVKVGFYDENDGESSATVTVNEQSKSFRFDKDLPADFAQSQTKTSQITHSAIELKPGDSFEIQGQSQGGEFARFDYIEFSKVKNNKTDFQKPLIDLRGSDNNVSVIFENISSDSSYNSSVGFYKVANANGAVPVKPGSDELLFPGQAGYAQAAMQQRVPEINLNRNTGTLTAELPGGDIYAPYLLIKHLFGDQDPQLYFNYGAANPDKIEHFKLLSNNQFGAEDKLGGGDRDYNDFTFKVKVKND